MIRSIKSRLEQPIISRYLVSLIVPLIFLILALFFYPGRTQFVADYDEGVELMKAMLVDRGFAPHEEVWSEHPPMLTYLLVAGFRLVGYKVGFSRLIVLGLCVLMMWAAGRILGMIWGTPISVVGQVLLIFLPLYLRLSVAVMNGLPSIAFGVLSLWALIEWHQKRKYPWLVFSAVLLGFSVLTKISLGFLGLVYLIGLLLGEVYPGREKFRLSMLLPAIVFGAVFSALLVGSAVLLIGMDNLGQVLSMLGPEVDLGDLEYKSINFYLKSAWPWIVLGAIGIYDAVREKKWLLFYLAAWAGIVYLLLLNHAPVWGHHQLYITIPLAMLSAEPAGNVLKKIWGILSEQFPPSLALAVKVLAVFATLAIVLPFSLPGPIKLLSPVDLVNESAEIDPEDSQVMVLMAEYKDQTKWVVTDNPMFAFRSRMLVPPELAVFSRKRLATGEVTEMDMISIIQQYKPEQVLIWRLFLPEVNDYLSKHYNPVYTIDGKGLWIRDDIRKIPSQ